MLKKCLRFRSGTLALDAVFFDRIRQTSEWSFIRAFSRAQAIRFGLFRTGAPLGENRVRFSYRSANTNHKSYK